MLRKSSHVLVLFSVFITAFLSSCSTANSTKTSSAIVYGDTMVSRMPVKRYMAIHNGLIHKISNQGVQFMQTGDELTMVLPSDNFFVDATPILTQSGYFALADIARLINDHEKFDVKVVGYTDRLGWQARNIALSSAQARSVLNALWERGIDSRLVYATGYGAQQSIANNITDQGRAMNRRIEITLSWLTDARQG